MAKNMLVQRKGDIHQTLEVDHSICAKSTITHQNNCEQDNR